VPASITVREEQYVVERHIYGMRWVNTVVPQPLIRCITLRKHNITEAGITILVRYNNGHLITY
jgi:hypothetical protein